MPETFLAFVHELPIGGVNRICVELPGRDLYFVALLVEGHAIPSAASGLVFDTAFRPLAFAPEGSGRASVVRADTGTRLGRFRSAAIRPFAPYRVIVWNELLQAWSEPTGSALAQPRKHDSDTLRKVEAAIEGAVLDGEPEPALERALSQRLERTTRKAISKALAVKPTAEDPDRVAVLWQYVEWLNAFDEKYEVIDTELRWQLCVAVDRLAEGLGLPRDSASWADAWRDW